MCVVGTLALAVALPEFRRYDAGAPSGGPEGDPARADVRLVEHDAD